MGKDKEGNDRGAIDILSSHLSLGTEEKHKRL
jgi:hypothetical protein